MRLCFDYNSNSNFNGLQSLALNDFNWNPSDLNEWKTKRMRSEFTWATMLIHQIDMKHLVEIEKWKDGLCVQNIEAIPKLFIIQCQQSECVCADDIVAK